MRRAARLDRPVGPDARGQARPAATSGSPNDSHTRHTRLDPAHEGPRAGRPAVVVAGGARAGRRRPPPRSAISTCSQASRTRGRTTASILHGAPAKPIMTPTLTIGDSQFGESGPEIAPYFTSRQDVSIDALLSGGVTPRPDPSGTPDHRRVGAARDLLARLEVPLPPAADRRAPTRHPRAPGVLRRRTCGLAPVARSGGHEHRVRMEREDTGTWRLLIFKILEATAPINVALLDAEGQPRTSPDSARGALPVGALVGMAVAPGVPLSEVQLSIGTSGATRLSPLRVAVLPRDYRDRGQVAARLVGLHEPLEEVGRVVEPVDEAIGDPPDARCRRPAARARAAAAARASRSSRS